ncbi:MAG: MiaB/RimO family radical SAM methylthiotransferase, partial [Treponema sp.]|nr:MiaB/RimO family radical SAM methylthiotransferase [Treponema sp.]
ELPLLKKEELCCAEKIESFIKEKKSLAFKNMHFQKSGEVTQSPLFSLYTPVFKIHSRPSLKIQDGCNNNCSFCRIHLARGKSVSLDADRVLERVLQLEQNGADEVVLTGVNLTQYNGVLKNAGSFGKDKVLDLTKLLRFLLENTSKISIRISSLYPQSVTEEFAEVIKNPRIRPFFHLSVQSGSNAVLKNMRRPYTRETVLSAVERLRRSKNAPFISCDIIAGFPGETDDDFLQTLSLSREVSFSWIHVFPFSARPGTDAFSMKNQVPSSVKSLRAKELIDEAVKSKIAYINSFAGKVLPAVTEQSRAERLSSDKKNSGLKKYHAVTSNYIHVEFESEEPVEQGKTVFVKIESCIEENILKQEETEAKALFYSVSESSLGS